MFVFIVTNRYAFRKAATTLNAKCCNLLFFFFQTILIFNNHLFFYLLFLTQLVLKNSKCRNIITQRAIE